MSCPNGYILAVEGLAKICIPNPNLYKRDDGVYEPSWAPVFYNPRMVENRDICVALLKTDSGDAAIVDPLAATGVRGIRIALEANLPKGVAIYMSDLSLAAIKIMEHNVKLNNLEEYITIVHADANELIYRLAKREGIALGYIDVDPFGSPAPFIHTAIDSVKRYGIVALTATDLAVLGGRYRVKLFRRYGVAGTKVLQSRDVAIRVLLSFVAKVAAIYDRYIEPLLSYAMSHYVRVYVRVYRGGMKASEILNNCLGALWSCTKCSYSYMHQIDGVVEKAIHCPVCGEKLEPIYPIWICPTANREYLEKLLKTANEMYWLRENSRKLLENIYRTSTLNTLSTRLTHIAKAIKTNVPSIQSVVDCLIQKGFIAAKSYTYSDGIATNASINEIIECVKSRTPKV